MSWHTDQIIEPCTYLVTSTRQDPTRSHAKTRQSTPQDLCAQQQHDYFTLQSCLHEKHRPGCAEIAQRRHFIFLIWQSGQCDALVCYATFSGAISSPNTPETHLGTTSPAIFLYAGTMSHPGTTRQSIGSNSLEADIISSWEDREIGIDQSRRRRTASLIDKTFIINRGMQSFSQGGI